MKIFEFNITINKTSNGAPQSALPQKENELGYIPNGWDDFAERAVQLKVQEIFVLVILFFPFFIYFLLVIWESAKHP